MKVRVDTSKCIGCGNCVALTESNVFDFNDDGLAQAIVEEVPNELEDTVKEAIEQCPTEAISEDVPNELEDTAEEVIEQDSTEAINE